MQRPPLTLPYDRDLYDRVDAATQARREFRVLLARGARRTGTPAKNSLPACPAFRAPIVRGVVRLPGALRIARACRAAGQSYNKAPIGAMASLDHARSAHWSHTARWPTRPVAQAAVAVAATEADLADARQARAVFAQANTLALVAGALVPDLPIVADTLAEYAALDARIAPAARAVMLAREFWSLVCASEAPHATADPPLHAAVWAELPPRAQSAIDREFTTYTKRITGLPADLPEARRDGTIRAAQKALRLALDQFVPLVRATVARLARNGRTTGAPMPAVAPDLQSGNVAPPAQGSRDKRALQADQARYADNGNPRAAVNARLQARAIDGGHAIRDHGVQNRRLVWVAPKPLPD